MIVVSAASPILSMDHHFVLMWPIPAGVVAARADAADLISVLDKEVMPAPFSAASVEWRRRAVTPCSHHPFFGMSGCALPGLGDWV